MCGPADYAALRTCLERLAALSAAGLSTYAVHQVADMARRTRRRAAAGAEKLDESRPCVSFSESLPASQQ